MVGVGDHEGIGARAGSIPALVIYETGDRQRLMPQEVKYVHISAPPQVCLWSAHLPLSTGAVGAIRIDAPKLRMLSRSLTQALLRPPSFLYPVTFTLVAQTSRTSVALKGMALLHPTALFRKA